MNTHFRNREPAETAFLEASLEAPHQQTGPGPAHRIGRADWLKFGPFLAHVVVTRRCNLSCAYCTEYDRTSRPVPFATLVERFRKLWALRTWTVCLTGGEPTLHPRLAELVARLRALGIRRRQMITNGYRLDRSLIERLNDSGLTDLQISIDGVRPSRTTVKTLTPLRRRLELLARFAKFRVVVNAVIGSAPAKEASRVVDAAQALGLTPRVLLIHDDAGQLGLNPDDRVAFETIARRLRPRFEDADAYRAALLRSGTAPFKCRAGARYLYVDEDGQVNWCSQTRERPVRALQAYTLEDLKEQFHASKPCSEKCTVGCARTASAYDGWRRQGAGDA